MLLSGGCVVVIVYLDDNVTVSWVRYRIIIFCSLSLCACACACVCVCKLQK